MTSESIDPEDVVSYDAIPDRERDGVTSLRDTEAEQGDEEYLDDSFELDTEEARDLDVGLDRLGGETPRLD
ncbi:MAG TPA: hypothetical protein VMH41_03955 [Mycobacteriales bacterium]|nr:hypothetical protein [Mycobacteriales bacterium]